MSKLTSITQKPYLSALAFKLYFHDQKDPVAKMAIAARIMLDESSSALPHMRCLGGDYRLPALLLRYGIAKYKNEGFQYLYQFLKLDKELSPAMRVLKTQSEEKDSFENMAMENYETVAGTIKMSEPMLIAGVSISSMDRINAWLDDSPLSDRLRNFVEFSIDFRRLKRILSPMGKGPDQPKLEDYKVDFGVTKTYLLNFDIDTYNKSLSAEISAEMKTQVKHLMDYTEKLSTPPEAKHRKKQEFTNASENILKDLGKMYQLIESGSYDDDLVPLVEWELMRLRLAKCIDMLQLDGDDEEQPNVLLLTDLLFALEPKKTGVKVNCVVSELSVYERLRRLATSSPVKAPLEEKGVKKFVLETATPYPIGLMKLIEKFNKRELSADCGELYELAKSSGALRSRQAHEMESTNKFLGSLREKLKVCKEEEKSAIEGNIRILESAKDIKKPTNQADQNLTRLRQEEKCLSKRIKNLRRSENNILRLELPDLERELVSIGKDLKELESKVITDRVALSASSLELKIQGNKKQLEETIQKIARSNTQLQANKFKNPDVEKPLWEKDLQTNKGKLSTLKQQILDDYQQFSHKEYRSYLESEIKRVRNELGVLTEQILDTGLQLQKSESVPSEEKSTAKKRLAEYEAQMRELNPELATLQQRLETLNAAEAEKNPPQQAGGVTKRPSSTSSSSSGPALSANPMALDYGGANGAQGNVPSTTRPATGSIGKK